jgi:hypothetical protein
MTTVAEFEVGGLALALQALGPLGFKLVLTKPYLDQISGLKFESYTCIVCCNSVTITDCTDEITTYVM